MRSLAFGLLIIVLGVIAGCSWQASRQPSILVIAVEGLHSEAFVCDESDPELLEGLGLLCQDGVRFTHAYSPSVMSQATLASILTGLYPIHTKVQHNGPNFLSEKFVTVAEAAVEKQYRTAFFSGGPPIWRKAGLDQGFELFEDNVVVKPGELFRPVQRNFELFKNWLEDSVGPSPFLSFIFLPDLQFAYRVTTNDLGQERAKTYESQLREISESLASLASFMRSKKRWDNTNVVIVGLNGRTRSSRESEALGTNLFSENTQVLLMIKPARKVRDDGLGWTIDANVSLVDLGFTIFDWLGESAQAPIMSRHLEVTSLASVLNRPQVVWSRDRFILSETAWASWRGIGDMRYAARQGSLFYIHDIKPMVFNVLVDQFELQKIQYNEPTVRQVVAEMRQTLQAIEAQPFEPIVASITQKIRLTSTFPGTLSGRDEMKSRLAMLIKQRPWDKQLVGWLAHAFIADQDWADLQTLGERHINPVWKYVAKRKLGQNPDLPVDSCWQMLSKRPQAQKNCQDSEFVAFASWILAGADDQKRTKEEKFLREFIKAEVEEEIAWRNLQNGLLWDTRVDIPAEPRLTRLALELPEYRQAKSLVDQRVKNLTEVFSKD
jgi:hypothetical protein